MPKCKNDPSINYSGKEKNPKGLGWCAHPEQIGKKRKGADGSMYIVAKRKNGERYWIQVKKLKSLLNPNDKPIHKKLACRKVKKGLKGLKGLDDNVKLTKASISRSVFEECKTTSDELWRSFSRKLTRLRILRGTVMQELKDAGIKLVLVRNPQDKNGNYDTNYPWKIANLQFPKIRNYHTILVPLQVDSTGLIPTSSDLFCQFENIDGDYRDAVIKIFTSAFDERFQWNGKETSAMILKLK
jgi:hypothetical protein